MNPFKSPSPLPPQIPAPPQSDENPREKVKEPFSHQAAKFSAYTPFILFLLGACLQGQMKAHAGTDTGTQLAFAIGGLFVLTTLGAFVLGVVGLVGGLQRRANRTVLLAVGGILLNALVLSVWGFAIFGPKRPSADQAEMWTSITDDEHGVSFELPGNPKQEIVTLPTQATVKQYQSHDGVAAYSAAIIRFSPDFEIPEGDAERVAWLNRVLDDWASSLNGRAIYRNPTSIGSLNGQELAFEFDPPAKDQAAPSMVQLATGRAYFVGNCAMTLNVVLSKSTYEQDTRGVRARMVRFFDSVKTE
jgi:hypothetical protein